jgi:hypothetical protein
MLHFDKSGELKRMFLLQATQRNKNPQLRLKALQEIAASRDAEAFDLALDEIVGWPRDEKREAAKALLQSLAEKRIGRRDQADAWIWRVAAFTAELHEEYAVQRWPETKRLLGLLANSSGGGHARNARRLVHATRKQDRRLSAALLAAATRYTHTPEAEEILRGARTRMSRKPASLSRDLLRNFPKGRRGRGRRRKKKGTEGEAGSRADAGGGRRPGRRPAARRAGGRRDLRGRGRRARRRRGCRDRPRGRRGRRRRPRGRPVGRRRGRRACPAGRARRATGRARATARATANRKPAPQVDPPRPPPRSPRPRPR